MTTYRDNGQFLAEQRLRGHTTIGMLGKSVVLCYSSHKIGLPITNIKSQLLFNIITQNKTLDKFK
jgi:hypothetical protein